jgi:alkylation response protein AidB-like acyl-CoA dehydrogenase
MQLEWSSAEEELYADVLAGAARLAPAARTWGRDEWRACGELGVLGLSAPREYGGGGRSAVATARALEAFGRGCGDMGLVFAAAAHLLACVRPIVEFGSAELQEELVPGLCSGALVGANAATERDAGSDVMRLGTTAVREGDEYVLRGEKSYVTNGPLADVLVVYASTNPRHGHLGITAFAVDRGSPGVVVAASIGKIGLVSAPACVLELRDCRVPAARRLGAEGDGAAIFHRSMEWERSCLFAAYVGMMERQLERVIEHARGRRQFGRPIGAYQAVSHRIVDMKLRLESSRWLVYRAASLVDRGESAVLAAALAKIAVSEGAVRSGIDAVRLHGALGLDPEAGVEETLRDALPATIVSGTSEILRNVAAQELGL